MLREVRQNAPVTTSTPAAADKPLYAKLTKRVIIATVVLVLGLIPSIVLVAITKEFAATWATVAYIAGFTAVLVASIDVAVIVVVVMSLFVPVAIVAGGTPVAGAALMAIMCLTVGRMSRFGLHRATMLVPIFMAWMIISPPFWGPQHLVERTNGTYLSWMTLIWFVGGIFPVIVMPFVLRKMKVPHATPQTHTRRESIPYTITITVLATAGTFWSLSMPGQTAGAWLIATIIVLAQVGDVSPLRLTIHRVVGTLIGIGLLTVIIVEVQSITLIYIIGFVFAIAAIASKFSPKAWIYFVFVTPAIVCLTASASSQLKDLSVQRVQDTLIGAVLVLIAAACTIGFSHVMNRKGHVAGDGASAGMVDA